MNAKVKRIEKTCPACGNKFLTTEYRMSIGRGSVCSRACNAKAHLLRKGATRHGLSGSGTQSSWSSMIQRCKNPKCVAYETYGAVGITVCDRWLSFQNFLDDMGVRPHGCSIDRINGTLGYFPENCRWATRGQQANNVKTNVHVVYKGQQYTISQLARFIGVGVKTLSYRLKAGWPEDQWHVKKHTYFSFQNAPKNS